MGIPRVILDAVVERYYNRGDSFRLKHEKKKNGDICTEPHKSPALIVTRCRTGWVWHCHRCLENGYVSDVESSPADTVKRVTEELTKEVPEINKSTVELPADFIQLSNDVQEKVPFAAYTWLWKYNITDENMIDYSIGWGEGRVIIPLFSSTGELEGYVGRDVFNEVGSIKYKITKTKWSDRLYFHTVGTKNLDEVVLVEDILSAIRVNEATGIKTIALLTTSIDDNLIRTLSGKTVSVWLDSDALSKSLKMVTRLRQLGAIPKHVYTTKDPKCYNNVAIRDILFEEV